LSLGIGNPGPKSLSRPDTPVPRESLGTGRYYVKSYLSNQRTDTVFSIYVDMYLCRGFRQNILADDKGIHSGYTLYGQWPDLSSHESVFQSRRVPNG
jgi:hypothetical protein